jgi:hypothetical protein
MASSFALDVSKWVEKAKGRADEVVRKVAFDMGAQIVGKSPVDTGRFKGNWFMGVAVRPSVSTADIDKDGTKTIARMESLRPQIFAGSVVYITNNLPYAMRLELGPPTPWSKQAPQGMVRVTVENYPGVIEQAVAEAKGAKP